ncbi:MAG: endonuclease [Actinomycetota bacterium]|nr:endonuclease [Actinomycetota bacterium]
MRVRVPSEVMVGRTVEAVEAKAKHLLIRFSGGVTLHTHMQMTGAWHVYPAGERWRKPGWQARVVLEAGDRVAVCFNAPTVELLTERDEAEHPSIANLGPDVLKPPVDLDEVRRRAATRPANVTIGELLLDQQVVSGIGNIYRCEALFLCRTHPRTLWADADLDELVRTASKVMLPRVDARTPYRANVYNRTGRPCSRCRTAIVAETYGAQPRTAYWCPKCQAL